MTFDTAMVFAAGLGTRMRPVTDTLPKPLVTVAGRTMLDHMLDRLVEAGVSTAVVNVHYLADQIEGRLAARGEPPLVLVSDERERLLDQGGGIAKALPHLGEAFLICNTDALWVEGSGSSVARLIEAWDPGHMDVLLLVADTATSVGVDWPGDFSMDDDGRLRRRHEGGVTPFVYAGVGIMKASLFAGIGEPVFKLAPFFFRAAEQGRLFGVRLRGTWLHVGTPEAIGEAEAAITRSRE